MCALVCMRASVCAIYLCFNEGDIGRDDAYGVKVDMDVDNIDDKYDY